MTIEFKCEHCEKPIRAADQSGGSLAPCPNCGHSMYVPLPPGQDSESLDLVELDADEEARRRELMDRTRKTMHNLWKEKPAAESNSPKARTPVGPAAPKPKPIDPEDAALTVEQYVVAMAQASLEEAEALAAHLLGHPHIVNPIIDQALTQGLPHPSLNNIPTAVQQGFLKKLRQYLNS